MSVYRRGKVYWYHFEFEGRHIQESSGFSNKTAALRAEARRKSDLLERKAGVTPRQHRQGWMSTSKSFSDGRSSSTRKTHMSCTAETATRCFASSAGNGLIRSLLEWLRSSKRQACVKRDETRTTGVRFHPQPSTGRSPR